METVYETFLPQTHAQGVKQLVLLLLCLSLSLFLLMQKLPNLEIYIRHAPASSGVAIPGPTRAQTLVKLVCALVKLLSSWA